MGTTSATGVLHAKLDSDRVLFSHCHRYLDRCALHYFWHHDWGFITSSPRSTVHPTSCGAITSGGYFCVKPTTFTFLWGPMPLCHGIWEAFCNVGGADCA